MTLWNGYLGVEDVNLTQEQRLEVNAAFAALGPTNDPQPSKNNHRRLSLDGSKAVYEAEFLKSNLTEEKVVEYLAEAVRVSPSLISSETSIIGKGALVVLSAGGVARMRMLVFGGRSATWDQSRIQAKSYIQENLEEWETAG